MFNIKSLFTRKKKDPPSFYAPANLKHVLKQKSKNELIQMLM